MLKHLREYPTSLFEDFLVENKKEFERSLKKINLALNADWIFLAVLNEYLDEARACVVLKDNQASDAFSYLLVNSPCEDVLTKSDCLIVDDVAHAYAKDRLIIEQNIQSYYGYPIRCEGKTVGLLVALSKSKSSAFEEKSFIVDIFVSQLEARLESEWHRLRLESSQLLFNEVCAMSDIGAWDYNIETQSLYWSDEVYQIYGIEQDVELTVEFALRNFAPEDQKRLSILIQNAIENGQDYLADFRFTDNFGKKKWVRTNGKVEKGSDGKPKRLYGAIEDITNERRILELEVSTARYLRGVLDCLNDAVVTINVDGKILSINDRAQKIFGYSENELIGQKVNILMPEPYASGHDNYLFQYQKTGHAQIMGVGRQLPAVRKSGDVFQMELALSEYKYGDNLYYVGIVRDITERIKANDTIYKLAFTDSITGLPNRASLEKEVTDLINRSAITENFLYFAYLNVDGLSNLNLTYGKESVNQLLLLVSQRISGALGNKFVVYKFKVDGFFIVSTKSQPAENIAGLDHEFLEADLLCQSLYQLSWKDDTVSLSVSMSSMITKVNSLTLDGVIDSLEFGMKKAKRYKPFGRFFLGPVAVDEYRRQKAIKLGIHDAILNNEFYLELQPQYRGPSTITSSEALIRWRSKLLGFVSPAEFIPIAEETDDIILIGDWVLDRVCALLYDLKTKNIDMRVSVNISAKQIVQPDFEEKLDACVRKHCISSHFLMLELTETTLVSDIELVKSKMLTLTRRGYTFSVDDFGTGYSSLSYIKELPLAELKIDKYFVDGIGKTEGVAATNIVNVVIDMAKSLNLEVVAEGVETQAQLNYLIGRGCDAIQGYLLSKPISEKEWMQLVIKHAHRSDDSFERKLSEDKPEQLHPDELIVSSAASASKKAAPIKNPHRFMTLTYAISLSIIAMLSLIVHVMLNSVINSQASSAGLINVSGQQRMLSQRSGMLALEYAITGDENVRQQARDTLQKMHDNHSRLTTEHFQAVKDNTDSPMSMPLQQLYFSEPVNIDATLNKYSIMLRAALSETPNDSISAVGSSVLQFLPLAKEQMLDAFNQAVLQYEKESQQRITKLKNIQSVVLVIIILTILAEALFIFRPMVRKVVFYASKLEYESQHDALSNLFNRRAFNDFFHHLFAQAKRYNHKLSVLVFDIDFFKKVNDSYGHDVGDKVIKHIGSIISANIRDSDILARIGGEEFALILPSTTAYKAVAVAEKIRAVIDKTPLIIDKQTIHTTVSIGVAEIKADDNVANDFFKRADAALYSAKNSGRNKVVLVSECIPDNALNNAIV